MLNAGGIDPMKQKTYSDAIPDVYISSIELNVAPSLH